jgi:hypothetical protein
LVTASNLSAAQALNPAAVAYSKATVIEHKASQWFNPNMFTTAPAGFLGDTPRGIMRGPGQVNWDLSMVKNTHVGWLGEKGSVQFRAEFFNILNHTNFAFPAGVASNSNYAFLAPAGTGVNGSNISATAAQITNTLINARQIQFALRFEF